MKLKQIKISDYARLKKYFVRPRYQLSGYSLPSIVAWTNDEYQPWGVETKDAVIIGAEFATAKEKRHLILPVSPTREFSPEALYDIAVELGFDSFWFVPEAYLDRFGKERVNTRFKIRRQKDYDDYVYRSDDLIDLAGNKYSKKRNLIHQFQNAYDHRGVLTEEPISPSNASECLEFLEKWCLAHDCDVEPGTDLACEKQAAINTIENIAHLDVEGLLLRINGDVSAFAVAAGLTDDMGVLHFEKADAHIKGLYQYFDSLCAKRLLRGYQYINKESDMDVPGLARAKRSYHPAMMIRSYELKLA